MNEAGFDVFSIVLAHGAGKEKLQAMGHSQKMFAMSVMKEDYCHTHCI
jgi:hypothetical protein